MRLIRFNCFFFHELHLYYFLKNSSNSRFIIGCNYIKPDVVIVYGKSPDFAAIDQKGISSFRITSESPIEVIFLLTFKTCLNAFKTLTLSNNFFTVKKSFRIDDNSRRIVIDEQFVR